MLRHSFDAVVSIGPLHQSLLRRCGCVIELPASTDAFQLLNAMSRIFAYYRRWDQSLREIVLRSGTVEDLLNASTEIFGAPIGIHDKKLECIIHSDYGEERKDMLVNTMNRRANKSYIMGFLEDPYFRTSLQREDAFFIDSYSSSRRTLAQSILFGGEFFYRVVISEDKRPMGQQDALLLEHLVHYIKPMMNSASVWIREERATFRSSLIQILEEGNRDPEVLRRAFSLRSWLDTDHYLCVSFVMGSEEIFSNVGTAISQQLQYLLPNAEVFLYNKSIVALLNLGEEDGNTEDVISIFVDYLRDMNMKCGVSNISRGYRFVCDLYRQSAIALKVGRRLWDYQWIYRFRDTAIYHILDLCLEELPSCAICAPEIIALLRYDEEHDTEYFRTIKTYLDCDRSLGEASRALFIHRTTLLYRLDKIQKLFPMALDKPLNRVYCHLSTLIASYGSCHAALPEESAAEKPPA